MADSWQRAWVGTQKYVHSVTINSDTCVSLDVIESYTCHFFLYFPLWVILYFLIFFTEVLMNTKTETSDIKWTIFSRTKAEVCNPSFTVLSVFLTQTSWWMGIFGFQLFLCYFGYKRVHYMAGNWQNKGMARANVGFKVYWKQMLWYIPSTLELKSLAAHNFEYCSQKKTYL